MTTEKINIEAQSINEAKNIAAQQLQVEVSQISYEIDRSHFRTDAGKSVGKETIKVFVSIKSEDEIAEESAKNKNRQAKSKREPREKTDRRSERPKIESEAGVWAAKFLSELIEKMGITAEVDYRIKERSRENVINLVVKSSQGGRLVGRRGSSLRKIKYILNMAKVKLHPEYDFFIDILSEDGKKRNERGNQKNKYSNQRQRLGEREIEKMKKMARKVGTKVSEDQKAVVITKLLNNFERKIIHEVISEMEGVVTESFNDAEGIRRIRIYPESNSIHEDSTNEDSKAPQEISSEDVESNVQSSETEE